MKNYLQIIQKSSFLVTGGAGFIGSHIAEYLVKCGAKKVRVLDDLSTGLTINIDALLRHSNFEFVKGDIRDLNICRKVCHDIDFVSHQAALGSVPRSIKDPITTNSVNVDGFLNVLLAAKDTKVKRFVYAASSSTYGDSKALPKTEDNIGKPLSPYAITKLVNELYADVFSKIYGIEAIGLRYFNVFGPRQRADGPYAAVIPLFFDSFINNRSPVIFGDGEQTRDFTFVENVIQANILAMLNNNPFSVNQVFNIAAGQRTSLNMLATLIAELCNKQDLKPIYEGARMGDVKDSLADITKANSLLGYIPQFSLKEGLEIMSNHLKRK